MTTKKENPMPRTKTETPLVVTTERGVFFGYGTPDLNAEHRVPKSLDAVTSVPATPKEEK